MGSFLIKASGEAAPRFLPPFLSSFRFFLDCTCCEDALGSVLHQDLSPDSSLLGWVELGARIGGKGFRLNHRSKKTRKGWGTTAGTMCFLTIRVSVSGGESYVLPF